MTRQASIGATILFALHDMYNVMYMVPLGANELM